MFILEPLVSSNLLLAFWRKFEKDSILLLLPFVHKSIFSTLTKAKVTKRFLSLVCIACTLGKGNKKQNFTGIDQQKIRELYFPETASLNKI
jgi:hypothetical protein